MKKNIIKISLAGVVVGVVVSTASFSVAASAVPTESPVESTKEYDDIQKMFLAIDKDTTEDDLLKLLEEYEVAYTAEDYNGTPKKRCYNIAFEEGAALQSYANPGDTLEVSFDKNDGTILGKKYFEEQLERIREIRLSERKFYQKITDIYATSIDYDVTGQVTKRFFATVQNKLHWAIHGQTAAEVVYHRADAEKDNMGLTSWKAAPQGKIQKFDVSIAKNYLTDNELAQLQRLVNAYLDLAEDMALRQIPMTMADWELRLNRFIEATDREVLQDAGKVTATIAKAHAESEFEKYRVIQDKLYESDFDREVKKLLGQDSKKKDTE